MQIELVKAPSRSFLEMLCNNIRATDRKEIEKKSWPAVGLLQAKLIDLYRAADLAEKASNVKVVLVMGNCSQHIQMLAILGTLASVCESLDKINKAFEHPDSPKAHAKKIHLRKAYA